MDIVKHYYNYTMFTMCGIPHIDIMGTKEDWTGMYRAISPLLEQLGLSEWNKELQRVLSHFARAFDGDIDHAHWNSIYNYYGPAGSGSVSTVSGWIAKLFLYTKSGINPLLGTSTEEPPQRCIPRSEFKDYPWKDETLWGAADSFSKKKKQRDPMLSRWNKQKKNSIRLADFPTGLTSTPFTWKYLPANAEYKMKLIAGHIGITLTPSGSLKPELGWLIADTGTRQNVLDYVANVIPEKSPQAVHRQSLKNSPDYVANVNPKKSPQAPTGKMCGIM